MSGLAGLSPEIINAITRNLLISDFTRAELRNFLNGNITTVTDEAEFTNSLKGITQDIEAATTEDTGFATGEILGALEGGGAVAIIGGVFVIRGLEIASELHDLSTNTQVETIARNRLRDQIQQSMERGLIHGAMGRPSRDINDLIRQQAEAEGFANRKDGSEEKRPITEDDSQIRQRPTSTGAEDKPLIDNEDDKKNTDSTGKTLPFIPRSARAESINRGNRRPLEDINRAGRRPLRPLDPNQDNTPTPTSEIVPSPTPTSEIVPLPKGPNPGGGNQQPYPTKSDAWLRPSFDQIGTDYFSKEFSKTPLDIENSEWAEFNYVAELDLKNKIQVDNHQNLKVRFSEPLFMPKYRQPLAQPSYASVIAKRIPMHRVLQITQSFENKFEDAEMGKNIVLYETYDKTGFDKNFSNLKVYNPL